MAVSFETAIFAGSGALMVRLVISKVLVKASNMLIWSILLLGASDSALYSDLLYFLIDGFQIFLC